MKHWNRFMFNTKREENSERLEIEEERRDAMQRERAYGIG
jgi:hypothetical protein